MKAVALIGFVAACGGRGTLTDEECRAEAGKLGDLLVEAAKEPPSPIVIADDVPLVARTDLKARRDLRDAPLVVLGPARIGLRDRSDVDVATVADLDALGAQLANGFARLRDDLASRRIDARWVPEPRLIYVAIDPATPWERVVAVVDKAATAGFTAPAFAFAAPQPLKPPPRSPMDDKLDALMKSDPAERATQVAKLATDLVAYCEPLQDSFGRVAGVEEDKAMVIARSIQPALVACRCKANLPELRSVLFRTIYVPRPLRFVAFDADAARQRIELPKATTWAEASKRLVPTLWNAELIAN